MATTKERINITADPDIERALKRAAKREKVPVATKAAALLRLGLELEEDLAMVKIIDKRLKTKVKFISHDKVWK